MKSATLSSSSQEVEDTQLTTKAQINWLQKNFAAFIKKGKVKGKVNGNWDVAKDAFDKGDRNKGLKGGTGKSEDGVAICKFYNQGNCTFGKECRMKHICDYVALDGTKCKEKHQRIKNH